MVLTQKAEKLLKLLNAEGYDDIATLAEAVFSDAVSPSICMTEGCDHIAPMEPDQTEGHCEACGGQTMVSAMVLAGVI